LESLVLNFSRREIAWLGARFMKLKISLALAIAGLVLQAASVNAADKKVIVTVDNKQDFANAVALIKSNMASGGRFEFTTDKERAAIDANLADMQSLFDKFNTVDAMDQPAKLRLFNDQEAVNTTLTHRDGDRLICEFVAPLGSNIPRKSCRTYRQAEQDRRDAQHEMRGFNQTTQPGGH
jgi:hypothetical protein